MSLENLYNASSVVGDSQDRTNALSESSFKEEVLSYVASLPHSPSSEPFPVSSVSDQQREGGGKHSPSSLREAAPSYEDSRTSDDGVVDQGWANRNNMFMRYNYKNNTFRTNTAVSTGKKKETPSRATTSKKAAAAATGSSQNPTESKNDVTRSPALRASGSVKATEKNFNYLDDAAYSNFTTSVTSETGMGLLLSEETGASGRPVAGPSPQVEEGVSTKTNSNTMITAIYQSSRFSLEPSGHPHYGSQNDNHVDNGSSSAGEKREERMREPRFVEATEESRGDSNRNSYSNNNNRDSRNSTSGRLSQENNTPLSLSPHDRTNGVGGYASSSSSISSENNHHYLHRDGSKREVLRSPPSTPPSFRAGNGRVSRAETDKEISTPKRLTAEEHKAPTRASPNSKRPTLTPSEVRTTDYKGTLDQLRSSANSNKNPNHNLYATSSTIESATAAAGTAAGVYSHLLDHNAIDAIIQKHSTPFQSYNSSSHKGETRGAPETPTEREEVGEAIEYPALAAAFENYATDRPRLSPRGAEEYNTSDEDTTTTLYGNESQISQHDNKRLKDLLHSIYKMNISSVSSSQQEFSPPHVTQLEQEERSPPLPIPSFQGAMSLLANQSQPQGGSSYLSDISYGTNQSASGVRGLQGDSFSRNTSNERPDLRPPLLTIPAVSRLPSAPPLLPPSVRSDHSRAPPSVKGSGGVPTNRSAAEVQQTIRALGHNLQQHSPPSAPRRPPSSLANADRSNLDPHSFLFTPVSLVGELDRFLVEEGGEDEGGGRAPSPPTQPQQTAPNGSTAALQKQTLHHVASIKDAIEAQIEKVYHMLLLILEFEEQNAPGETERVATPQEELKLLIQRLKEEETVLSELVVQYVQYCNISALKFINLKQFSFSLQLLLLSEEMTASQAGRLADYSNISNPNGNNSSHSHNSNNNVNNNKLLIPYFAPHLEERRLYCEGILNNNFGLYHYYLKEYTLSIKRMKQSILVEEYLFHHYYNTPAHHLKDTTMESGPHSENNREYHYYYSIGITYFNIAQAYYQLAIQPLPTGRRPPADPSTTHYHQVEQKKNFANSFRYLFSAESSVEKSVLLIQNELMIRNNSTAKNTDHHYNLELYLKWRENVIFLVRIKQTIAIYFEKKMNKDNHSKNSSRNSSHNSGSAAANLSVNSGKDLIDQLNYYLSAEQFLLLIPDLVSKKEKGLLNSIQKKIKDIRAKMKTYSALYPNARLDVSTTNTSRVKQNPLFTPYYPKVASTSVKKPVRPSSAPLFRARPFSASSGGASSPFQKGNKRPKSGGRKHYVPGSGSDPGASTSSFSVVTTLLPRTVRVVDECLPSSSASYPANSNTSRPPSSSMRRLGKRRRGPRSPPKPNPAVNTHSDYRSNVYSALRYSPYLSAPFGEQADHDRGDPSRCRAKQSPSKRKKNKRSRSRKREKRAMEREKWHRIERHRDEDTETTTEDDVDEEEVGEGAAGVIFTNKNTDYERQFLGQRIADALQFLTPNGATTTKRRDVTSDEKQDPAVYYFSNGRQCVRPSSAPLRIPSPKDYTGEPERTRGEEPRAPVVAAITVEEEHWIKEYEEKLFPAASLHPGGKTHHEAPLPSHSHPLSEANPTTHYLPSSTTTVDDPQLLPRPSHSKPNTVGSASSLENSSVQELQRHNSIHHNMNDILETDLFSTPVAYPKGATPVKEADTSGEADPVVGKTPRSPGGSLMYDTEDVSVNQNSYQPSVSSPKQDSPIQEEATPSVEVSTSDSQEDEEEYHTEPPQEAYHTTNGVETKEAEGFYPAGDLPRKPPGANTSSIGSGSTTSNGFPLRRHSSIHKNIKEVVDQREAEKEAEYNVNTPRDYPSYSNDAPTSHNMETEEEAEDRPLTPTEGEGEDILVDVVVTSEEVGELVTEGTAIYVDSSNTNGGPYTLPTRTAEEVMSSESKGEVWLAVESSTVSSTTISSDSDREVVPPLSTGCDGETLNGREREGDADAALSSRLASKRPTLQPSEVGEGEDQGGTETDATENSTPTHSRMRNGSVESGANPKLVETSVLSSDDDEALQYRRRRSSVYVEGGEDPLAETVLQSPIDENVVVPENWMVIEERAGAPSEDPVHHTNPAAVVIVEPPTRISVTEVETESSVEHQEDAVPEVYMCSSAEATEETTGGSEIVTIFTPSEVPPNRAETTTTTTTTATASASLDPLRQEMITLMNDAFEKQSNLLLQSFQQLVASQVNPNAVREHRSEGVQTVPPQDVQPSQEEEVHHYSPADSITTESQVSGVSSGPLESGVQSPGTESVEKVEEPQQQHPPTPTEKEREVTSGLETAPSLPLPPHPPQPSSNSSVRVPFLHVYARPTPPPPRSGPKSTSVSSQRGKVLLFGRPQSTSIPPSTHESHPPSIHPRDVSVDTTVSAVNQETENKLFSFFSSLNQTNSIQETNTPQQPFSPPELTSQNPSFNIDDLEKLPSVHNSREEEGEGDGVPLPTSSLPLYSYSLPPEGYPSKLPIPASRESTAATSVGRGYSSPYQTTPNRKENSMGTSPSGLDPSHSPFPNASNRFSKFIFQQSEREISPESARSNVAVKALDFVPRETTRSSAAHHIYNPTYTGLPAALRNASPQGVLPSSQSRPPRSSLPSSPLREGSNSTHGGTASSVATNHYTMSGSSNIPINSPISIYNNNNNNKDYNNNNNSSGFTYSLPKQVSYSPYSRPREEDKQAKLKKEAIKEIQETWAEYQAKLQ